MTLPFRPPKFWRSRVGLLALALSPWAALYGAAAAARLRRAAPSAALPTIAVGGLTLGGDGKTPATLALARMLLDHGERPAILARGYGGARESADPLRVDPARHAADDVGDEALLLAAVAPTYVGGDRAASARRAQTQGATVLLLDDGLHGRHLEPDLSILVVDAGYGAGNGLCPPAGPLRAPLAAQLARIDAAILIGDGEPPAWLRQKLLTRASLAPDPAAAAALCGARVFAVAGIGRPEKFARSLKQVGAELFGFRWFADHHEYSQEELARLECEARRLSSRLVTTEKDARRLGARRGFEVLPVTLDFAAPEAVAQRLGESIAAARAARCCGQT